MLRRTFGVLTLAALAACGGAKPLTETQRAAIADSVNAVVQGILADVNQRSSASFKDYSADPDARFVENGVLYPSLEALRSSDSAAKTLVTALNVRATRSEEHTSELQSPVHLVCRLLLEKKNKEDK